MKCPSCKRKYKVHCRCRVYQNMKKLVLRAEQARFASALEGAIMNALASGRGEEK